MYKKDLGYLFIILKMCDDIELYKRDHGSIDDLLDTRIGLNAVLMNISQIGEYAGKISDFFKEEYNQVKWQKIKGLRNIIVHDYFGIDIDKIKKIIKNEIPKLTEDIKAIITDLLHQNKITTEFLEYSSEDFQVIKIILQNQK